MFSLNNVAFQAVKFAVKIAIQRVKEAKVAFANQLLCRPHI